MEDGTEAPEEERCERDGHVKRRQPTFLAPLGGDMVRNPIGEAGGGH